MANYKNPKINITKVYTKAGDSGSTYLIGGISVSKDDIRVKGYGDIEELNVLIGVSLNNIKKHSKIVNYSYLTSRLMSIQNELFNLGTILASTGSELAKDMPQIEERDIKILENDIDRLNKFLDPLKSFILPSGDETVLSIHHSRVVCRRVERHVCSIMNEFPKFNNTSLKYLNRLSDYLFVLCRFVAKELKIKEELWKPNNITSEKI